MKYVFLASSNAGTVCYLWSVGLVWRLHHDMLVIPVITVSKLCFKELDFNGGNHSFILIYCLE